MAGSFKLAHQFLSVGGLPISPAASRLGRTGALHVHRYSLPGVPPSLSYESLSKTNSSFHLVPMGGVGPPLILTVIIRLAPSCGSHRHFKKWLAALPAIKGPCPPLKLKNNVMSLLCRPSQAEQPPSRVNMKKNRINRKNIHPHGLLS